MTFKTESEIQDVVDGFESCRTGKDDFHHQQHLVVAASYLESLPMTEATSKMRAALFRFLDHHEVDKQKYNETLTVFWLEMVALQLKKSPASAPLVEKCNAVISVLSNAKLALEFYSADRLWSDEARKRFVDPDLKQWK